MINKSINQFIVSGSQSLFSLYVDLWIRNLRLHFKIALININQPHRSCVPFFCPSKRPFKATGSSVKIDLYFHKTRVLEGRLNHLWEEKKDEQRGESDALM